MQPSIQKNRGFTLIELMVVVAIIGILAAIAYPSYQGQIRKSNRAAAQAVMMDAANKQQFYLSSQRQYSTVLDDIGIRVVPEEVTRFYTITMTVDNAATPPTFVITGTPLAGTKQVADGVLTLNSAGDKKRDGTLAW